ncbi:MAG: hypothetical protein EAX95_10040 [Candidatus Thorarchaeota archaeon]|nr:hypothetical protein [Candidatus Thorarchaeota archaeon]
MMQLTENINIHALAFYGLATVLFCVYLVIIRAFYIEKGNKLRTPTRLRLRRICSWLDGSRRLRYVIGAGLPAVSIILAIMSLVLEPRFSLSNLLLLTALIFGTAVLTENNRRIGFFSQQVVIPASEKDHVQDGTTNQGTPDA